VREALTTARDSSRGDSLWAGATPAALARLIEAAAKPLAVVTAPAGFGKSTLLREFSARQSALFIDLASGESTLRDAIRALCEALRGVAPGARLAFASAYARSAERGQRAGSLARWLARYLDDTPVTVVVDSVDRLGADTRSLAEFLEALVRDAHGAHFVIAVRDDADLPIPRWFAAELTAMPIGADDLRWTVSHARSAAHHLGTGRDVHTLEWIVNAANGRPFDIVYALHTGASPPRGEDPGRALFRSLDRDERRYVMETCLPRYVDEELLSVAGLPVHPLLTAKSRLGSLLVRRSGSGYQYDDALRLCAAEVLRTDATAYRRVAEQTVDALAAVLRVREALEVARTAELHDRVHRLLREHGLQLEDRGDVDAVDAALDVLAADGDDATILVLRASRESRLGRTDTSEAWFRHAISRAESRSIAAEAAYRLAREIVRRDRSDAVELLEPYAFDETLGIEQRSSILSVLAEAYVISHRPDDAHRALRAALAYADRLDVGASAHVYTRASYIELYAGDRDRAREYATIGAARAEEAHLYVMAFGAYSVLYNVAYDDAGPSESLVYLERLGDCAIRSGNLDFHLYAIVAAYELQVERGDLAAIERLEHDLREFDLHYGASAALQGLLPSRAVVAAWKGAFASAYQILASTGRQQDDPDRAALRWAEIALYAAAAGMRVVAADALRSFAAAYSLDGGSSQHAVRGSILARLAASIASESLPAAPVAAAGRLGSLARAVESVVAVREGSASFETLLAAFEDLRRNELFGMAKLLAALPVVAA
jgi:hypothetical protein